MNVNIIITRIIRPTALTGQRAPGPAGRLEKKCRRPRTALLTRTHWAPRVVLTSWELATKRMRSFRCTQRRVISALALLDQQVLLKQVCASAQRRMHTSSFAFSPTPLECGGTPPVGIQITFPHQPTWHPSAGSASCCRRSFKSRRASCRYEQDGELDDCFEAASRSFRHVLAQWSPKVLPGARQPFPAPP